MKSEVDRCEVELKVEYQPPMLLDYGLLAKEAAADVGGSTADGAGYS